MTPKKRVELERYKVVRPEWIVDCVKAGKALPWNQYRLIDQSNQKTIGFAQKAVDSYRAVSSRDEKTVYGGGGLQKLSQESSSYPTPPEMKAMDLETVEYDVEDGVITEAAVGGRKRRRYRYAWSRIPKRLVPDEDFSTEARRCRDCHGN